MLSKSLMIAIYFAVGNLCVVLFNVHVLRVELFLLLPSIVAHDSWLIIVTFFVNFDWHRWLFTRRLLKLGIVT
jgi:hypothetical protein